MMRRCNAASSLFQVSLSSNSGQGNSLDLSPYLHRKHIIIRAGPKSVEQHIVAGFQKLRKLPQEGDHIGGRAHVPKFSQQPGHGNPDAFPLEILFDQLVDLIVCMVYDRHRNRFSRHAQFGDAFLIGMIYILDYLHPVAHKELHHTHRASHHHP